MADVPVFPDACAAFAVLHKGSTCVTCGRSREEHALTYDIPGLGHLTAVEFAQAYNMGRVPLEIMKPGGSMSVVDDGRGVHIEWREDTYGSATLQIEAPRAE